jgi:hypothetical protein
MANSMNNNYNIMERIVHRITSSKNASAVKTYRQVGRDNKPGQSDHYVDRI